MKQENEMNGLGHTPRREPWIRAVRKPSTACAVAFFALLATGCTSMPQPVQDAGQVKQIIQCTLKHGTEPATVLAVANDFGKLPGVIDVSAGYAPPTLNTHLPERVVTFIVTFKDNTHYSQAIMDPEYARIRDQVLKPISSNVTEFGTALQNYLISKQFTEETDAATQQRRAAALKQQNDLRSQTK